MAGFFIDRPIFAWVIAIVIMLGGGLAISQLPLEQYPDIAPPTVRISATYTGASAKTVEDSVTQADVAQMQVQNKLQQAESRLPQSVQSQGITVTKGGSDFLMIVALRSDNPRITSTDIGDFISSTLLDQVARVDGVGEVQTLGTGYAMRIWLDPAQLDKYALMPSDITSAIEAQNTEVSAGQLGALPAIKGQQLNATISARSKLTTPQEFRNIVVKSSSDGSVVLLSDVARGELGAESYDVVSALNGKPAAAMGITLATGANALDTASAVKARIAELESSYPHDMQLKTAIPYDTTPFVSLSIKEVLKSLGEAIVLVVLIMYLFLQNLRATLIPAITVPVVLLGTFGVLSAVFIPMAFFGGSTGVIYRQFSVTIVSAMLLSVLVAMTLSPALCATLLKPGAGQHSEKRGFCGGFNRFFARSEKSYQNGVGRVLRMERRSLLVYGLIIAVMVVVFTRLPGSFLPDEDQGILMGMIQLPVGATDERTQAATRQLVDYMGKQPEVDSLISITGLGLGGNSQNSGRAFIKLKDWRERTGTGQDSAALARQATQDLGSLRDANVFIMQPPTIRGLGQSSGFDLELKDVGGVGHDALVKARDQFITLAKKSSQLVGVRSTGLDDTPELKVSLDDRKASAYSLSTSDINSTLATAMGGTYVNDFIHNGRVEKVYVQGDVQTRMQAKDLNRWYVRNSLEQEVPFSAFSSVGWTYGSPLLERYNGNAAMEIVGDPASGVSSGEAMSEVESIIAQLPGGIGYEWAGQSYQERLAGDQAPLLYAISVLFVFLCLAALYESWSVPFSVMLVVPLGVVGAVLATRLAGLNNDVYFQVGLLTTVGLAAKNAILIVEFAKQLQEQGRDLLEATLQAARQRLRPVLMTSLAFMFGVLPLALSSGAGSGGRRAIGTGVLGGMLTATMLGVFLVPLFFVLIRRSFGKKAAVTSPAPMEALP